MNISTVQIATYCIGKRILGYDLLRNPKGVPATTVRMIKKTSGIYNTLDTYECYSRVTKDFSQKSAGTVSEIFESFKYPFYDNKCKKVNEVKDLYYKKTVSGKSVEVAKNGDITDEIIDQRDLSGIERKTYRGINIDFPIASLGKQPIEVPIYRSFADDVVDKYYKNKKSDVIGSITRFVNNLKHNLQNG